MSSSKLLPSKKQPSTPRNLEIEERKALLSGGRDEADEEEDFVDSDDNQFWSRRKVTCTAIFLISLLVAGTFARTVLFATPRHLEASQVQLQSNGTHEFKKTVLIVSIDGLRADYLDRNLTPHLLALSKRGLRAKSMKPVFPTLTFPNHWTLMTGLYAESHGIVANNFWDPRVKEEFHYNQISSTWNPAWWSGEPMWETAEKAGVITANLMWPGPPKTASGASPTYFIPWKDKVPLDDKLNAILHWIDLPLEKRPQLIMAYEPSLDQAGHATGPNSKHVNETLVQVDLFAKNLHDTLADRNLTDIVDIIFVSDHGMTDTSHPELIYMDDFLGADGLKEIEHNDGWPSMGLRFHPQANVSHRLASLLEAADENPEKFDVYTHDTMPQRYHFANHERIAPIYIIPKIGYVLTTKAEGDVGLSKGNHGYDNDEPSMHAIFVAHGPFSMKAKAQHERRSHLGHVSSRADEGWHSISDNAYVMKSFQNVEIYNLIMNLLDITDYVASTNGTAGFWNQYL